MMSEQGFIQKIKDQTKELRFSINVIFKNPLSIIGLTIITILIFVAIFGPQIAPYNPIEINLDDKRQSPNMTHFFGTDNYGRDILSRVLYGASISVYIAITAVGLSAIIGTSLGIISGYYGDKVDTIIMRIMDMMLAFPSLILAMGIAAALGIGVMGAIYATGIVGIPGMARLVRGQVLSIRENQYIEAARATGASDIQIMLNHVLPNVISPIIVLTTLRLGGAILTAAALGFIGLGVKPPTPEWGAMVSEGRNYLIVGDWWMATFPGLAIAVTVLGFNLFGDGLRDILDPRLRR
jgi:peptide/nickel transport system permease protein